MNVWLDDERPCPDGYVPVKTAFECISLLEVAKSNKERIEHISLDHDLGEGAGCGYDVVTWIEEQVFVDDSYVPPKVMTVHSANAGARKKMLLGIESIERRFQASRAVDKTQA